MTSIFRFTARFMFVFACLTGAASVLIAAYSAHIPGLEEASLRAVQSALQMMQFHTLALLIVVWPTKDFKGHWPVLIGAIFFTMGIVLFSFNIALHHLAGVSAFRALTPIGGMAFIFGWALLALSGFRPHHQTNVT